MLTPMALLLLAVQVPTAQAPAGNRAVGLIALRASALVDVEHGLLIRDAVVVIRDGMIDAAGPARTTRIPAGARIIEMPGRTLLPGLIDAHVHLTLGGRPRENAIVTLRSGFTTVMDLGALRNGNLVLRDSINIGRFEGPRIIAAGPWIGVPGGVCDFDSTQVGGDSAIARHVREAVRVRADVIKICVTGWPRDRDQPPEMSPDEVRAAIAEARLADRTVLAHAIGRAGARLAIEEGVDALVHAAFLDDDVAGTMRNRGVPMIPTLLSFEQARDPASLELLAYARRAIELEVPIVFGTDAGVIPHGRNAEEFSALARAGLATPLAIRAATADAARLLGLADSVGVLRPGLQADIIAVPGDPFADLRVLEHVSFVMQRGRIVVGP